MGRFLKERNTMPEISYDAHNFNALPPTSPAYSAPTQSSFCGNESFSMIELLAHACTVGDSSILHGGPARPQLELQWRQAMVESSLQSHNGRFARSDSYIRLDGSEKSAVSYFLGMVQGAAMSTRILGVDSLAHVDAVLKLLGRTIPRKARPDLIGYTKTQGSQPIARILLEAKGRTDGYSQRPVDTALKQVKSPPSKVANLVGPNPIAIASMSYFSPNVRGGEPVWTSYLEDPPLDAPQVSTFDDAEFCGLVTISQLLPIAKAINQILETAKELVTSEFGSHITAHFPLTGMHIGLPARMYSILQKIDGPLTDKSQLHHITHDVWELTNSDNYLNELPELWDRNWASCTLPSGLTVSTLGQEDTSRI